MLCAHRMRLLAAVAILAGSGLARAATDVVSSNASAPVISFSTFLGGSRFTGATGVAVDGVGNIYVTGWTEAADLPVKNALQSTSGGGVDAFVAKFDPTGSSLLYSTYLGGSGEDRAFAIAVDSAGSAYVTGWTYSSNFPTAAALTQGRLGGGRDAFVAKLSPAGNQLVYSTFLGGSENDAGRGVGVDINGCAYVAGETTSSNFPTLRSIQATLKGAQNGFVALLDSSGKLAFSSYLGGSSTDGIGAIAVSAIGEMYVTGGTTSKDFPVLHAFQPANGGGQDAFVSKLNPYSPALIYSTYLGGSGGVLSYPEMGTGIDIDLAGNVYVTGVTSSWNFPVQSAVQSSQGGWLNAFVSKLNAAGSLVYSSYLGGSGMDYATAIRVDSGGSACIGGFGWSTDFPVLQAVQAVNGGSYDAFLSCLAPAGNALVFSTLLGGGDADAANALARDAASIYLVGQTNSSDFPLATTFQTVNRGGQSAFVTRFSPPQQRPAAPVLSSPGNGASSVPVTAPLSWNVASGATSYSIYLGTSLPPPLFATTSATAYTPGALQAGATYYWQIMANNSAGSASSATWSFSTQAPCSNTINPTSAAPGAAGGIDAITVTALTSCAWTAVSNVPWAAVIAGSSGNGSGSVFYWVGANPASSARSGTLSIGSQTFTVNQAAAPCTYAVNVPGASVPSWGGTGSVSVTAPAGCFWTAASNASWVTITAGNSSSGSGTATYSAMANPTAILRTGTLSIAGQAVTLTQQPPVGTNTEAFVRQLYLDLLSRTAEGAGLSVWVNYIDSGQYTRAQVAAQFFQSPEFNFSGMYITRLYMAIMLRDPDYGGWNGWFNLLRGGQSRTYILNQFLGSQEFQLRYGSLDNTAFITLVYNNVLKRSPDPAGLAQWVHWLDAGTYTRAEVMDGFISSAEYTAVSKNRAYSNLLYMGFLRRAGDAGGLDGWANWLNNGTYTLEQVVNGFISSAEYLSRF